MYDGLERDITTASSLEAEQGSGNISKTQTKATPFGQVLQELAQKVVPGNTSRSGEGSMQLLELMVIYTKLSDKVTGLEDELKSTKVVYNKAIITLTKRVKNNKQGEAHEKTRHRIEVDDTASPQTDDDETLAETLLNIKRSVAKDNGKAIMQESESPNKIKKKDMMQISLDEEIAQRFYEEEQAQILMDDEYAQQIQADENLAQRMLEKKKESLYIEERSRLLTEFIDKRRKMLAAKRAEEKRNKPPTQAQQRIYMINYIKNMARYTLKQLKQYYFEEIKILFDNTMESIRNFVPMDSEGQKAYSKAGEGSSKEGESLKRPAEKELGQEQQKKQKVKEDLSQERLRQMMIINPEQGIHVEALQTNFKSRLKNAMTRKGRKDDEKLRHVANSPQWRKIDKKFLKFGKEIRNIRFGLSSDGINPFGNMSSRYKGSILEGYAFEEVIDFYTNYLEGVKGIGVPQSHHVGRLHGVGKRHILGVDNVVDEDEYDQFDELPSFSEGIPPIDGENTYLRSDHDEGLWHDLGQSLWLGMLSGLVIGLSDLIGSG
nr:hypothetical protein [Tanacetum cinerariifolium]